MLHILFRESSYLLCSPALRQNLLSYGYNLTINEPSKKISRERDRRAVVIVVGGGNGGAILLLQQVDRLE